MDLQHLGNAGLRDGFSALKSLFQLFYLLPTLILLPPPNKKANFCTVCAPGAFGIHGAAQEELDVALWLCWC